MLKVWGKIIGFCLIIYILLIIVAYFNQESLLFHPSKTKKNHSYETFLPSNEIEFYMPDSTRINGLIYQQKEKSKGLIFYLHGNAGSIENWKNIAESYFHFGYDVFIYDYRGFGKSSSSIKEEKHLTLDAAYIFKKLQAIYQTPITIIAHSLGTGIAIDLASKHKTKQLILLAPYFSMQSLARSKYPFLPSFILKYPLRSDLKFKKITCPIYLFHGANDGLIPVENSEKLYKLRPKNTQRVVLQSIGHNGLDMHPDYRAKLDSILCLDNDYSPINEK
jgi:uncharacterized protein